MVGDGGGGLMVAEPSLLNVNVRHLLLRLYDPLLFVCICGMGATWRRSRRREGRLEKAEKEQAAPPTRRSAIRCGFCPCFWCMSFFLFLPPLYPFPHRADALGVSHRLGTRSFVKFYDGRPRCALYPLCCIHYGSCGHFFLRILF